MQASIKIYLLKKYLLVSQVKYQPYETNVTSMLTGYEKSHERQSIKSLATITI
jgi:hypothetical protein